MGLEASCPVSRIVMDSWRDEVKTIEERTQMMAEVNPIIYEPLEVYLLKKYVDDVLSALETMKLGLVD